MGDQQLSLTVAGAANCTGARGAINAFLSMVRTAATIEPHYHPTRPGELPTLMPQDLRGMEKADGLLLSKKVTYGAAVIGLNETCFRGGSTRMDDLEWSLCYDRGIRPFADVQSVAEYWRIREQVLGPVRTQAENLPFSNRQPQLPAIPAQAPAAAAAAAEPVVEASETLTVAVELHPMVVAVAAERYNNGFYLDAVRSAFQAVEHRVASLVGVNEVGERLMGIAFGKPVPKITVTRSTGGSLESEQTGMQFLFKGAMGALRNPRMHGPDKQDDRDEAAEMLVIASFLMRRLDIEHRKQVVAAALAAAAAGP